MNIAGIDPGQSGAIAIIDKDGVFLAVEDMPVIKVGKHSLIAGTTVRDLLNKYNVNHVYMEDVHAMPGNGVVGMFNFGIEKGCIMGICVGLFIPYTLITPRTWKKHMLVGKNKADKGLSLIRAAQLYPAVSFQFKKDHGKAEALLIAEYGRTKC